MFRTPVKLMSAVRLSISASAHHHKHPLIPRRAIAAFARHGDGVETSSAVNLIANQA